MELEIPSHCRAYPTRLIEAVDIVTDFKTMRLTLIIGATQHDVTLPEIEPDTPAEISIAKMLRAMADKIDPRT